jgi:hypothetical protein
VVGLKWARVFFNRIAGQLCWVSCLTTILAFLLLLRILLCTLLFAINELQGNIAVVTTTETTRQNITTQNVTA